MLASLDTGIAVPHLSGGVAHVALLLTRCQRFSHEILNDCSKMALGNLFSLVVWLYVQYVGDCNKCKYAVKAEIRGCPLDCSDKIAAMATYILISSGFTTGHKLASRFQDSHLCLVQSLRSSIKVE